MSKERSKKALDYLDKQSSQGVIEDVLISLNELALEAQLTLEEKLAVHYQARDEEAMWHLMDLIKKIRELKGLIT